MCHHILFLKPYRHQAKYLFQIFNGQTNSVCQVISEDRTKYNTLTQISFYFMLKLLQIYFIVSFSLFTSVITKLYTASHSLFEAYITIFEKKNYFIVILNFILAIGIILLMFIQNYFMGKFQEAEYKQATNEIFGFIASIFILIYYLNLEFVNLEFIILIFCRYLICLINVRVNSFSINFENASVRSHRKLILLQFALFIYCFSHLISSLKKYKENSFNIMLMNQYFLCCNSLFESIVNQMIIISDDQGGNSITAYYGRQKLTYYGSLFSFAIDIFTGIVILKGCEHNKFIFLILSLYDPLQETFKKINNYKKWKKFCTDLNMLLSSPTDEELEEHDTCIICRMKLTKNFAKKLPCGHIFHLDCMIVWFGSRQICPLCGADIHELLKQINQPEHAHAHDNDVPNENDANENANDQQDIQYNFEDFDNDNIDLENANNNSDHAHKHRRHRSHKHKSQPINNQSETTYSFSDFADIDQDDDNSQQNTNENLENYMFNPNNDHQNDNNNNNDNVANNNNNADLVEELKQTKLLLKEFEQRVKYLESLIQNKNDEE